MIVGNNSSPLHMNMAPLQHRDSKHPLKGADALGPRQNWHTVAVQFRVHLQ